MDKQAREALARRILALSTADETEVVLLQDDLALTRFNHEIVHQNVVSKVLSVRVRVIHEQRCGVATTTALDDAALQAVVARALDLARLCPPDAQWPGLPQPAAVDAAPAHSFDAATAACPAETRADGVDAVFMVSEQYQQWGAGYLSTAAGGVTIANSHGVCVSFDGTEAVLNVKQNAANSTGYGEFSGPALARLQAAAVATVGADKAAQSADPGAVAAGDWTVFLEPVAFGEFLSYLTDHFSAQAVDEGGSFLRWDMLGQKSLSADFTMIDDWSHELSPGIPFDYEGSPRLKTVLIDRGAPAAVVTDSRWSARLKRPNTGHALPAPNSGGPQPLHITVPPGQTSRAELLAGVSRGLLISRFWYIRPVDRRKTIVTGMTRDGTFLIENGKIKGGVHNLRFNMSILGALQHIRLSDTAVRTSGLGYTMVVPGALIENFHFSSTTSF